MTEKTLNINDLRRQDQNKTLAINLNEYLILLISRRGKQDFDAILLRQKSLYLPIKIRNNSK